MLSNKKYTEDQLEPNGGNLYKPHKWMVNSGMFWRCKHGTTGFNATGTTASNELEWWGCTKCAADDPKAYRLFTRKKKEDELRPKRQR